MPFWRNYFHLVWATKGRRPLIRPEIEVQLYAYLARKADELGVRTYEINGTEDHIHIVAAIPPKQSVAEVVRRLKGSSSHYVNTILKSEERFAWQRGYGCLTLGESQRERVEAYVRAQKEHHRERTTNTRLETTEEEETD